MIFHFYENAGQEKDDFWEAIGGKGPYRDEKVMKDVDEDYQPRLFHGSNATGNFQCELLFRKTRSFIKN